MLCCSFGQNVYFPSCVQYKQLWCQRRTRCTYAVRMLRTNQHERWSVADTDEMDDALMLQLRHHLGLGQEVGLTSRVVLIV